MADKTILTYRDYRIVPTEIDHVGIIASNMRELDRQECIAAIGLDPADALYYSFTGSENVWTILYKDKPIAIFGVARLSLLSEVGVPWMLGTDELDQAGWPIIRFSRKIIRGLLEYYSKLENYVDARNKKSIKWLRWCGFIIEPPEPYGAYRLPFHRFHLDRL